MQGVSRLVLLMALKAEQLDIIFEVYFILDGVMSSCYKGVGQEWSRGGNLSIFTNFISISGWRWCTVGDSRRWVFTGALLISKH